jgi:hypothetical protein
MINGNMRLDVHNEISRRLRDDTMFDQSIVNLVQQSMYMCCDEDEFAVYQAYAKCYTATVEAYIRRTPLLSVDKYAFIGLQDGEFKLCVASIEQYTHTCLRVAFLYACAHQQSSASERQIAVRNVQAICTHTLSGTMYAKCDCIAEDDLFTKIARKNHSTGLELSIYDHVKRGRFLFVGASVWQLHKLNTTLKSQLLFYRQSKRQKNTD